RSGYPEPLLKGIDLGIKKFIPTSEAPLYSIIYNQFLAQKISTMIDREQSFFSIYFFVEVLDIFNILYHILQNLVKFSYEI
ncbi:hypothetical protein ABTJ39_19455, partial [Acinetobacter baumannii]